MCEVGVLPTCVDGRAIEISLAFDLQNYEKKTPPHRTSCVAIIRMSVQCL